MTAPVCQRWRSGRATYRPVGEPFEPRAHEVEAIPDDATAKTFVERHHYSGSYPAARFRVGLFERWGGRLVGVAVFSVPVRAEVTTNWFEGDAGEHTELGRFVLLDHVAANAETWFLARCVEVLQAERIRAVVSFADPLPRETEAGHLVAPGHVGTIYQAKGAIYAGRARARTLRLLPNGRVLSDRTRAKLRAGDRGWRHAADQLVRAGADAPTSEAPAELRRWADLWVPRVCRSVRHPGNHRYLFPLHGGRIRPEVEALPYPKLHV